jgi:hypothetical protein
MLSVRLYQYQAQIEGFENPIRTMPSMNNQPKKNQCVKYILVATASAAERFFIAAVSAAMKKIPSAFSVPRAKRVVKSYQREAYKPCPA